MTKESFKRYGEINGELNHIDFQIGSLIEPSPIESYGCSKPHAMTDEEWSDLKEKLIARLSAKKAELMAEQEIL